MTLAATYDLELHQADVEGAYLNGDLDRDIFMRVPKGYTHQNPGTTALKLIKQFTDSSSPVVSGGKS